MKRIVFFVLVLATLFVAEARAQATSAPVSGAQKVIVLADGFYAGEMGLVQEFVKSAEREIGTWRPFNGAQGMIHFEVVRVAQSLGCRIQGRKVICDPNLVLSAARAAGATNRDEVCVLYNSELYGANAYPDQDPSGENALATYCMVSFGAYPTAMLHELGHSVFGLEDAYYYPSDGVRTPFPAVNCVSSPNAFDGYAETWTPGCGGNPSYFRAEQDVMANDQVRGFNRVSVESPFSPYGVHRRLEMRTGRIIPLIDEVLSPMNFQARVEGHTLNLSWDFPAGARIDGFNIEVGSRQGFADLAVVSLGAGERSYTLEGVPDGTYYVRIRARVGADLSPSSVDLYVLVSNTQCQPLPLAAPVLSTSVSGGVVNLSWSPIIGAEGYAVSVKNDDWDDIYDGVVSATSASGVLPAGTYYVAVSARNACSVSLTANATVVVR